MRSLPLRFALPAVLLAMLPGAPAWAQSPQGPGLDAVPGELVVRFEPSTGAAERGQAREQADVDVVRGLRVARAQLVEVEPGQSVADAIAALEAVDGVASAEPNWIFRASSVTPDDTRFGSLWGLGKIDAPEAWTIATGSPDVVVAVADTGVAYDHPDLAANIWSNLDEPAGNGDDDGNGFADDTRGWDFVDGDNDPRDLDGHGTHVAGTLAGVGNNGLGITGVSWGARIMPVRVLGADGSGTYADIVDGFDYAGDNGAQIVNASLGGEASSSQVSLMASVMAAHPATLFVVAAGNDSTSNDVTPHYPCNIPAANLVCVASTTASDGLSDFSNVGGTSVDLGAPGEGIWSTIPATTTTTIDTFESALEGWTAGGSGGSFQATATPSLPYAPAAFRGAGRGQVLDDHPDVAAYQSGEDYWIKTNAKVGTAGSPGCLLTYDVRYDLDENFDRLRIQTSATGNGNSWTTRENITGYEDDWVTKETWLGPNPEVYVRLRLVADDEPSTDSFDGVQLDDLAVRCIDTGASSYSTSDYASFSGTSMAAPHVAGAAAVLAGAHPSASVANLRTWLLTSGDPLSALGGGKTATGRRLNLHNALQLAAGAAIDPVAVTGVASGVTQTTAALNGMIDPNGTATSYRFEWGETTAYGQTTPVTTSGSGSIPVAASHQISGLTPGTTYHYRIVALRGGNPAGLPGLDASFTSAAPSPPAPPVTDVPAAAMPGLSGDDADSGLPAPSDPLLPGGEIDAGNHVDEPSEIIGSPPLLRLAALQPIGGLRLRANCAAPCTAFVKATGSRSLRRVIGGRVLLQRATPLPAGSRAFELKIPRDRLRRLRRAGLTRVKATLVLGIIDASGKLARSTVPLHIRIAPR